MEKALELGRHLLGKARRARDSDDESPDKERRNPKYKPTKPPANKATPEGSRAGRLGARTGGEGHAWSNSDPEFKRFSSGKVANFVEQAHRDLRKEKGVRAESEGGWRMVEHSAAKEEEEDHTYAKWLVAAKSISPKEGPPLRYQCRQWGHVSNRCPCVSIANARGIKGRSVPQLWNAGGIRAGSLREGTR